MTKAEAPMTGAALKVTLGGLGIPPSWFAEHCGVTMRTVVRWFDADTVAPRVADKVKYLYANTSDEMARMTADPSRLEDGSVLLETYRTDETIESQYELDLPLPASWHRALTFRVVEQFRRKRQPVTVEYLLPLRLGV